VASVKGFSVTNVAAGEYEPAMLDDEHVGDVHWLRTEGSGEGQLLTGLWMCQPRTISYVFPGDETFYVLEGELRVEVEGGDSVDLTPGDIASFSKGQVSTWTISKPFKSFFVVCG
jgi:uncharacterized cupin superfamily protein